MNTILLLAAITLIVLILRVLWKWVRKLQRRYRRRRGNNYLYQDYDYKYEADYEAIDSAWETSRGNVSVDNNNEANYLELELDSDEPDTNNLDLELELDSDEPDINNLDLELELDSDEPDINYKEDYWVTPNDYNSREELTSEVTSTQRESSNHSSCESYDDSSK